MTETEKSNHKGFQKESLDFLKCLYENQYNQRWRDSRRQDWIMVGTTATITLGIIALFIKSLNSDPASAYFPIIIVFSLFLFVFSEVGFRILLMHKQVMNHAEHIANGIEAHFGIRKALHTEEQIAPSEDSSLYVGSLPSETDANEVSFTYPSKRQYREDKPLSYWEFSREILKLRLPNVQTAIGLLYRLFQCLAALIIFYLPPTTKAINSILSFISPC